jgi:glycosyltransferase involved in cell wall biosynthesis
MLNILALHIRFAEFDRCSGDLRLTNMLRALSARNKVSLHILYKPNDYVSASENAPYLTLMRSLGIDVRTGSLRAHLRARSYDAVVIEFWYVARHIISDIRALQPEAKIVVDTEHVYFHSGHLRAVALGRDPESHDLVARKREELDTYARADLVITTTGEDKEVLLKEDPLLSIATVPNIHDIPLEGDLSRAARKPNSLIFVGNFRSNPSNADAVTYFCREILPLIRRRIPDATLAIVGNMPPDEVKALANDHIVVTGYVPETAPYLDGSKVLVCPLRYGAGLKGKIGEAMARGLPVVTTSIGTQGMNPRLGEEIMVGDTPEQFADCVERVLRDAALWQTLSREGRALIVRNYSPAAVAQRIETIASELRSIRPKRYGGMKRLVLKSRFNAADLLDEHLFWRFRRAAR